MEIKILCPCGTKYKFDIEPIHHQLPAPVQCPVCHADGTSAANNQIAEKLGPFPQPVSQAPVPVASQSLSPRLGVSIPGKNPVPAQHVTPQPLPALPTAQKRPKEYTGPSNLRGIIGATVAGLIGMIIWTVLIIVTNHEIGWVA